MSGIGQQGSVRAQDLRVAIEDVRQVERIAARAWPATEMTTLDNWLIRYSPGVANRRANSVLPIEGAPLAALAARIKDVEAFYAARNLPARFMISPAALPNSLDATLAGLKYRIDAPTLVQWGRASDVVDTGGSANRLDYLAEPTQEWMTVYMEETPDRQQREDKAALIRRIAAPYVLAQVEAGGAPAAVGLCVLDQGWAGLFCMHTLQSHRRQGLARRVLRGLMDWARSKGATRAYLQVESDNPGARQLYESSGFCTEYGYHYRTKEITRVRQ